MAQGKRYGNMVKGAMAETTSQPRPYFDYSGLLLEWLHIIEFGTNEDREFIKTQFLNNNPFTPNDQEKIMDAVRKHILKTA